MNNARFSAIYASPGATAEKNTEVIIDALADDDEQKTVLVRDFNIDFNSENWKEVIEALSVIDLRIRTNPTGGRKTTNAIFSNKIMRTGVYTNT